MIADSHDTPISDAAAQRLIARAIELDARSAADVSLAQVRAAVLEAGVSPTAFDTALAELRATLYADTPSPIRRRGKFAQWWARLRGHVRGVERPALLERAALDVAALGAFALVVMPAMEILNDFGTPWVANRTFELVAAVAGIAITHRLGATLAKCVLTVLLVLGGTELVVESLFGGQAAFGNVARFALLLASALGVGVGALLGRRRDAASDAAATASATAADETAPWSAPDAPRRLLRLRHAWMPRPTVS